MENFKLIYDFENRSLDVGVFYFLLIFLFMFGAFSYEKYYAYKGENQKLVLESKRSIQIFAFFSIFSLIFSLIVISRGLLEYYDIVKIYKNKNYKIIEGIVNNYEVMPKEREHFNVKDVVFDISYYTIGDYGYKVPASKGGVIKEGLFVRIYYYNSGSGNIILRLETK